MNTKYNINDKVKFTFTYRGSHKNTIGTIISIMDTDFCMRMYGTQLYIAEVGIDNKKYTVYESQVIARVN
jgi:hypothetical protein